jgi:hypothetical protein
MQGLTWAEWEVDLRTGECQSMRSRDLVGALWQVKRWDNPQPAQRQRGQMELEAELSIAIKDK